MRIESGELIELPWELFYDPELHEFLSLTRRTPVVRQHLIDRPCHILHFFVQSPDKCVAPCSKLQDGWLVKQPSYPTHTSTIMARMRTKR